MDNIQEITYKNKITQGKNNNLLNTFQMYHIYKNKI